MANAFREQGSHSAEYFGDTRDFWWNADFLALMANRLAFDRVRDVLDVGCGVGHWGLLLANVLPDAACIHGVDRDPHWVDQARARAAGLARSCHYQVGVAERLPFADASFDLVTCQTVLIHTADPGAAIDEMLRVARPGGLILASEPNNISRALVLDSLCFHAATDDILAGVRLQLLCERGKAALGEGNNSIGDLLPGLFAARGLADVRVYLNDKTNAFIAPYDSPEQRAVLEETADLRERDFWIWSRGDTLRYFLAGGGKIDDFSQLWRQATQDRGFHEAIAARSYAAPGAAIQHLVCGRKPSR